MPEREFTAKPRRKPLPPQNQEKWLVGFDGVEVILETDPARMAYFAREASWADIMREPTPEEMADTMAEISRGGVLGVAYKAGMGFRIRASRSTMDQMLRLAEGRGGTGSGAAAQTTRDSDMRDFNIIIPRTIEALANQSHAHSRVAQDKRQRLYDRVKKHVRESRSLYTALVEAGVPFQDARYPTMPIGFQTQWMHIMSPGNFATLCETRLCGLVQHETNYLVRCMRDAAVQVYPWMDKQWRSACEKAGECVSSKNTMLFPPCGAYVKDHSVAGEPEMDLNKVRLRVQHFDPDLHLYPVEKNDSMRFVEWDIERQQLESENPGAIYSMSGPPEYLTETKLPD